MVKFY